jgi:hypothetical protein
MPHDLKALVEGRQNALHQLNELRTPLWEAIVREIDLDKKFAERAGSLGKRVRSAFENFRAGKVSRVHAIETYKRQLEEFRIDYEARSIDALWNNAKLLPSTAEMIIAWYGKSSIHDLQLRITTDKYLGWFLQKSLPSPDDVGSSEQGLGGDPAPPPLNTCAMPPFALEDDQIWGQLITAFLNARSIPQLGTVAVGVNGVYDGGSSGHSLVGADFNIPAGFTTINVSADIDWSFNASTFVVGGVAGSGADLLLWIENPAGSAAVESSDGLFQLLSPVIWGNSASGMGSSTINGSISTPDANARTIRVLAGISGHAEAATIAVLGSAGSDVEAGGTVKRICISAT